jgi:hypothetical protein
VPRAWTDPLVRLKQWKRDTRFGTRNAGSLYRSGSLTTVARKLGRYKSDLVGVQGVRWGEGVTVRSVFCMEKKTKIIKREQDFSSTEATTCYPIAVVFTHIFVHTRPNLHIRIPQKSSTLEPHLHRTTPTQNAVANQPDTPRLYTPATHTPLPCQAQYRPRLNRTTQE